MKTQVIYFSRKGSTKKIAEAIASELKTNAEDVKTTKLDKESFIFLGSGCYGGKPGRHMTKFIENNDFKNRNIALFGTSGGGIGAEVKFMEKLLKDKDANIKGEYFCKGRFWFGNKDKPTQNDIDEVLNSAEQLMIKLEGVQFG